MQTLYARCKCFVLEGREIWEQVSPLFAAPNRVEMAFLGSNVFCFMRVEQKGGRGGGTNWAIPAKLNRGWGAAPVIGFGMDAAG